MKKNYLFIIILFLSSLYSYAQVCTVSISSSDADNIICANESVTFTATATDGALYQWRVNGVNVGPNSPTTTFTPAMPFQSGATVTVTLTPNTANCTGSAITSNSITTTVNPNPAAPTAGQLGTVCTGETISLTATAVTGATYLWTGPDGFTSSLQNPTITSATAAMAGIYSVKAVVSGCSSSPTTTIVTVNSIPLAPAVTSNIAVCTGESITLSASSISGATYLWTGPNGFTSTLQNPTIAGATAAMAGNYSVKATVANCTSVASSPTAVIVNPLPSAPSATNSGPVCVGGMMNLGASFITGATYLWSGPNSFSSTDQNPTISSATATMAGVYSVKVTVSGCTSNAATTTVVVNAIPSPPTVGSNSAVCAGGTINLTASPISGATYSWSGPNSFTSNLQNPTITGATATMAGNYYVTATVAGCTSASSAPAAVVVNAIPAAPAAGNGGAVCVGGTINLTASPIAGAAYLWTGPNSFSSTLQNPTIPGATPAMAGNYSVKAIVLGCTSAVSSPTLVTVNTIPPAPTVSSNSPVCIGGAINLTASSITGANYLWTGPNGFTSTAQNPVISGVTAAAAGTYSVIATVGGCTSNAASTSVVANPTIAPSVTISSNSTSICSGAGGTPVTFTATPTNGGSSPSYQWKLNGNNIAGATSSTYTTSLLANLSSITVVLTSNAACPSSVTATSNSIVMTGIPGTPAKPNSPTSPVTSVCPVASGIQLSVVAVPNATTYEWSIPPGWTITSGDGSNTITLSVNGTASTGFNDFQVRAGNACGYSAFSTPAFKIKVDSFAAVNAGIDQTICSGNNINLSATLLGNAATITWTSSNGGSFSDLNSLTSTYTPSITSGTVTLTATTNNPAGNCNAGTDQVIITVNQPPAITMQPIATQTLCSGSSATFSVAATGTGLAYQWQKGGIDIPGATSATLTLNAITTTDDGNYTVKVSGASPCTTVTSSTASLTINQIVAITTQPLTQTQCSGSTATFNVIATGTGLTYQWQKAGTDIAGATSASFSINAVSTADAGDYTVKITGTSPCSPVTSATASLTINQIVAITTQPITQTVCSGSSAAFTVVATGSGLTYQWQKGGTDIAGATAAILTLNMITTSDAGNYTVKVSGENPCAAINSASAVLTVNQIITITTQPVAQTVCSGSTATFNVAATGSGLTYQWQKAGSAITGANSASFSLNAVSTADAADYSVIVSGINPCSPVTSSAVTLAVNEIVAITAQPVGQTVCSGDTTTFNVAATGTGLTYQWKKAGSDIAGATSAALTINSASAADAGDYSVIINGISPCAAVTSSKATLVVNQQVSITTQPNDLQTVCSGFPASFSVSATGTGLSYEWFKDGISTGLTTSTLNISQAKLSDAGTYTVVVKGATPCTIVTSNNAVLNVNQEINIVTQPTSKVNCEGDTTTFEVAATGSSLNYLWRKGGIPIPAGGNISGEATATLTITGAVLTNAGSYDVVVSGSGAICAQTISTAALLTLNTKSANPTSASATAPVICSGASTILNLTGGGGGTTEVIKWYSDSCGGTLVGTGNGLSVSPTTSTTYYGRYENTGICSYDSVCASVAVTVNYNSTISLSSAIGTDTQTKCINNAIIPITYAIGGGGSTASVTAGALPTGITGLYSGGIFTISGTPTVFGTFNYTVTTSGPCNNVSLSGVLTINPNSTIILTSAAGTDNQTKCINNVITPINYAIGAIGTSTSITAGTLPTGLTGVFSAGVFTISGTPSIQGIFNYTVTTAGLCNNASLSGTITVNPDSVITLNSAAGTDTQSKCINNAITPITYTVGGGGTGASITGGALPTGVTASFATGTFTISGTPSVAGTFSYTVTTSGSCTNVSLSGTITVTPLPISTFNYGATTFCKSAANPSLNFTGGGVAGVFTSSPGGLTINASTGAIDLTTSSAGTYDVTNTFASTGGCITVSHTEKITIDPINIGGSVTGLMDGVAKTVITSCHEGAGILNLTGNTGNVIKWEYSVDGGVNWTADNSNKTNTYNYIGIKATTLYRAAIQSGVCDIVYSAIAFVNVIPPNIKPSPVSATPTVLCLGDTSQFTSQSSYGTGQFLQGGDFQTGQLNTQDPKGWLVDGAPGGYTASGDNTKPNHWAGTNPHPFPGGIFYNSGDPKFAIANGQLTTILETPVINSLGLTSFNFGFDQAYNLLAGDRILIELSTNGGTNYTVILQDITGPAQSALFNTFANDNTNFDLQKYIGQTQLRVRFTFKGVNTNSAWALDNFKFPDAPAAQTVEWTDEKGNIIGTTNTVGVKPTAPGIRVYGVTSLINGCRSTGIDGTVFVTVNVNYAYAGKDVAISPAECGTNTVSLNAYDNSLSAAKNILKGAYTHIAQPNEDPDFLNVSGTGASGKWTIKSSTATCGPGNFSTKNPAKYPDPAADPDAIFTGDAGTYVLTWTSGGCSDDVTAILTNCTTVDFDGDNDNVTFKDNYDITTDFSIEIWVKPNSVSGTQTIFSKRDANNLATGYDLKLSGTKISFNWNAVGTIISPFEIGTDRWYHIAVTFSNGTYKLYIDGINVQNTTGALPGSNNFDSLLGAMDQTGNPPNKPVNHFKGWMDELRIWNVALTPEQLHQMMNQEIKSNGTAVIGEVVPIDVNGLSWTTNLLGYYRMDVNNCGHLVPTAGAIDGKLRNITTILEQTAPIPYTSRADGQDWGTDNTWTHFNVWDAPNSKGVDNSTSIEWNIVETSHNINSGNKDITVLGLISKVGKLTIANPAISAPIEANIGKGLWITLYLKLNGSIDLVGESQLVQKRYLPTYFNESILDQASTGYIERDQQGQRNSYNYNYWSSPVSFQGGLNNAPYSVSGVIKDGTNSADPRTISFQDWKYSADGTFISPIIISNQWIWSYNAPVKSTDIQNYNQWNHIGSTGLLKTGEGFTMKGTGGTAATDITQNYVFVGKPNNETISLPLPLNQIYLIGNPYPSALDADEFIKNNLKDCVGCTATQNVFNGTLYFWDHFRVTDNHILEEYVGGYAAYNLSGGVLSIANSSLTVHDFSVGSKVPKRYIPVAQGFFIDAPLGTSTATPSLNFNNNQRVFERENVASSVFMKAVANTKTKLIDTRLKIRLGFDSFVGMHRQLLVTADSNTTSAYDIGYDAPIFDLKTNDMFWEIDNKKYVIQGINNFNEDQIIPLGLTISDKGPITIQIDELENITESTKIYLYDAFTASYYNIRDKAFTISLEIGEYKNRFSILFVNKTLSVEETILNEKIEILYANNYRTLIIQNKIPDTTVNDVYLINILGQTVSKWDVEDKDQTRIQIPIKNFASGVYIVKLKTSKGEMSEKIIIK